MGSTVDFKKISSDVLEQSIKDVLIVEGGVKPLTAKTLLSIYDRAIILGGTSVGIESYTYLTVGAMDKLDMERERLMYSVDFMAKKLGISRQTYYNLKLGKVPFSRVSDFYFTEEFASLGFNMDKGYFAEAPMTILTLEVDASIITKHFSDEMVETFKVLVDRLYGVFVGIEEANDDVYKDMDVFVASLINTVVPNVAGGFTLDDIISVENVENINDTKIIYSVAGDLSALKLIQEYWF